MTDWATIFLGVIAVATLATAIVQVGVLVAASRLARRLDGLMNVVEQEIKPILGHFETIGRDASRAASLAAAQVERVDHLFALVAARIEEMLNTVRSAVTTPVREAGAILAGLRMAVNIIRDFKAARAQPRAEEHEDSLFI